jgi:hypothetical protein
VVEDAALSEDEVDDDGDDMGADKMIKKAKASAKGMDTCRATGMVPKLRLLFVCDDAGGNGAKAGGKAKAFAAKGKKK